MRTRDAFAAMAALTVLSPLMSSARGEKADFGTMPEAFRTQKRERELVTLDQISA